MARARTGAAAGVSVARARPHEELSSTNGNSSNGRDDDPNQWQSEFTLLWLDLLEKHGHATEVAAQLAAHATASTPPANGYGAFRSEPQHQADALRAATSLQESMQSVSELLSNVEEIIRKRLIDDAPAPCSCRTQPPPPNNANSNPTAVRPLSQAKANSLDVYLRGAPLESEDPTFVNAVRGWEARGTPVLAKAPPNMVVLDGLELHDAMMRNNLRLVGMHSAPSPMYHVPGSAGNYGTPMHRQYASVPSLAHTGAVHRVPDAVDPRITPKRKLSALSPMTHNNSSSSHASHEQPSHKRQQQQQQQHTDAPSLAAMQRGTQKQIQSLHAERVLQFRDGAHVGEYLVQWRGIAQPQWVARRLCGEQAKLLVDEFSRKRLSKLRRSGLKQRVARPATAAGAAANTSRTSRTSRSSPEDDIFIVDKIVGHRLRYKKKQYLVKWDGYDSSENTWECATKLQADVADVVDAYERKLAARKEKQGQEQQRAGTDADVSARPLATRASAAAAVAPPTVTTMATNTVSAVHNDSTRVCASPVLGNRRVDEPAKHAHAHVTADSDVEIVSDGDHDSGEDDGDAADGNFTGSGSDRSPLDADDDVVEIDGSDSEHAGDSDKNTNDNVEVEEED